MMKNYKKLYKQKIEENTELKSQIIKLQVEAKRKKKEVEPYCIDVYFDEKGENYAHIENVIEHKVGYKPYPDCRPENWEITTADGLTSVFKYDKVDYVLSYREDGECMSTLDRIAKNFNKAFNDE